MPKYNVEAKLGNRPRTAKLTQNVVHSENSRLNSGLSCERVSTLRSDSTNERWSSLVTERSKCLLVGGQFSIVDWDLIATEN